MESIVNSRSNALIITSSNRSDILLAVVALCFSRSPHLAGLLISGNPPPQSIMSALHKVNLPVLLAIEHGLYTLASMIHDLTVKVTSDDGLKIKTLTDLFMRYVKRQCLYDAIFAPPEIKMTWQRKTIKWPSEVARFFTYLAIFLKGKLCKKEE